MATATAKREATAAHVLEVASRYVGTQEDPAGSNRTIFGRWYGPPDGEPWCAKFTSYVLDECGIRGFKHKYTPSGADLFKAAGRWHATGKPGDLAFFDFPGDGVNRISHVGLVVARNGSSYETIEGNTRSDGTGSQRDGDGVYRRRRAAGLIVGFGRPPYAASAPAASLTILRRGSKGRRVLDWQRDLNRVADVGLVESGTFDAATERATIRWQRKRKLEPDGQVGPLSLKKMAAALAKLPPEATTKTPGILRRRSRGEAVTRLQRELNRHGATLKVDGDFGAATEKAVRAFQKARKLEVDGEVGPRTWAAFGADVRNAGAKKAGAKKAGAKKADAATGEAAMELSDAGVRFIARFEGFRPKLYDDPAGHCTIGYGHLVHRGPTNGQEPAEFRRGITETRGRELLRQDAAGAARAVREHVRVPLSQPQFDALVSFTFNLGAGSLARSTLLQKLNAGDYRSVPAQLSRWTKAGGVQLAGLVRRREAEGRMFSAGEYGSG